MTLIAVSLAMVTAPVFELLLKIPVWDLQRAYWAPAWLMPVVALGSVQLFPVTLHFARRTGRMHGRLARKMLVSG